MSKTVLKEIETLNPGDLVCIFWNDASIGSSFTTAGIPVPVKSVGIYVGYAGEPKHAILCQNDFSYNLELHDVDYTAIPFPWFKEIQIIKKAFLTKEEATLILKNILTGAGTRRRRRRIFQMRTNNHEKLD
ncbi:MAG: hypothetical protein QXQ94_11160 [Candidatus Bathyarchaeia archaeon]